MSNYLLSVTLFACGGFGILVSSGDCLVHTTVGEHKGAKKRVEPRERLVSLLSNFGPACPRKLELELGSLTEVDKQAIDQELATFKEMLLCAGKGSGRSKYEPSSSDTLQRYQKLLKTLGAHQEELLEQQLPPSLAYCGCCLQSMPLGKRVWVAAQVALITGIFWTCLLNWLCTT